MSKPTHILLIDDDELSREILALLFAEAGVEITAFLSGEAALAQLAEPSATAPINAVLTDMQMPGLHGAALATALRRALPPGTPLIAMSGSAPPFEALASFDAFLLKPFTPDDLLQVLKAVPDSTSVPVTRPGAASFRVSDLPRRGREAPALDDSTFDQLAALMQAAQLRELLALSLAEADRYTQSIHDAVARNDEAGARAAAHALKGSVAMIGARELQALAATLETPTATPANQAASLREIPPAIARLRRILLSRGIELPPGPLQPAQGDTIA